MKQLLLIFILTLTSFHSPIDVGDPSIMAVCRVTTQSGNTVEGFVTLVNGGYYGMHANGFYSYRDDHYNWITLFNLDLDKLSGTNYDIKRYFERAKEVHFIVHTWETDSYSLAETNTQFTDEFGKHLLKSKQVRQQYKMFDSIPLFMELPSYIQLNYNNAALCRQKVAMTDIASIEILRHPDEKWLAEIEKKRKLYHEDNGGEDSSGDFYEPQWAHELLDNPKELTRLKEAFKNRHGF